MQIYCWGEENVPFFTLRLWADLEFGSPLAILPEPAFLLMHVDFGATAWVKRQKEMYGKGIYSLHAFQVCGQVNLHNPYMSFPFAVSAEHPGPYSEAKKEGRSVSRRTTKLFIPMRYFRVRISSVYSSCTSACLSGGHKLSQLRQMTPTVLDEAV